MDSVKEERKKTTAKGSGYDRIIKYTGVFGGVQTLTNLITLVKGKLVAALIGSAGMGITTVFNRSLDLVSRTTDLGISFSAVKTISEQGEAPADSIRVVRSWSLWLAVLGTAVCFLLAPLFSRQNFDGDYSYTLSFRLLSLVVGFTSIASGERAILKGTQKLRELATNQIYCVVATLLITIPVYLWLGMQGIVPVLVLTSLANMLLTCWYSFRAYPYRVALFSGKVFHDGAYIVRLGINYTLAGFFGSGVLYLVSSYMMNNGSAEDVGYYSNAVILVSYLSMLVFSAVESDFFPRLSAANRDPKQSGQLVNEQIEVLILLVSPLVVVFMLFLPIIVPLVLQREFMPLIDVAQWAAAALLFTALTRPMSFMSLSKGDSLTYLIQELFYDVFMAVTVIVGYREGGLLWAGVALFASSVFDWLLNCLITRVRYGFRPNRRVRLFALLHGVVVAAALCLFRLAGGWVYWLGGVALAIVSGAVSVYFLYKETDFLQKVAAKLKSKYEK